MKRLIPRLCDPMDDRPPVTVITGVGPPRKGRVNVRGVSVDDGVIRAVNINGHPARPMAPNSLEWEADIEVQESGVFSLTAGAEDAAGNVEPVPHRVELGGSLS